MVGEGPRGSPRVERLKRRVYLIAFVVIALAGVSGYALGTSADRLPIVRILFGPVMAIIALVVGGLLWSRRLPLPTIEMVSYVLAGAVLTGRIGLAFFTADPGTPVPALLMDAGPWVATVFILCFVMLDTRRAVWAAVTLWLVLLAVVVSYVVWRGLGAFRSTELNALIQTFVLADAVYVLLLFFLSRTKEEYGREHFERKVMVRLAHTDELTGIPNRRHVTGSCRKELERLARAPRPFSVILFDIDHFKRVNDVHGHATGDEVLKRVTSLIHSIMRAGDELGRYGGEEFLILAYDADRRLAERLAERLRSALAVDRPSDLPSVTASFGVAGHQEGDTLETLLARADAALYDAKEGGRNRVCSR